MESCDCLLENCKIISISVAKCLIPLVVIPLSWPSLTTLRRPVYGVASIPRKSSIKLEVACCVEQLDYEDPYAC